MDSRQISLTAFFATLYAVGVVFLAPISFNLFQVRIADALLPLSMLFGWPGILGFGLGCLVANVFGGLGPIDIVGGAIANIVGCGLAYEFSKSSRYPWRFFAGGLMITATLTLIVGTYLAYLFFPLEFGLPAILLGWLGVLLGSIVAVNIVGYLLLEAVKRTKIHESFSFKKSA
jgi:uncharacterized membrane protein